MSKYIYTNSNMLMSKIMDVVEHSKTEKKKKKNICPICNESYEILFVYTHSSVSIEIYEHQIHMLKNHKQICMELYSKICELNLSHMSSGTKINISWMKLTTNGLNIIDGLYEVGSKRIYSENKKNLKDTHIFRYSEHSGYIYFENDKINKVIVHNSSRTDPHDPFIYMPTNNDELFKVDYIFHTHPKTPFIGSRIKMNIIYEFPSISDIIHFVEHHNNGKLIGSIVVSPEGCYVIRKNNFNRDKIKIDYDIFISSMENVYNKCYGESVKCFADLNLENMTVGKDVMIPDDLFHKIIASNYRFIDKINDNLIKHDLFIDYYTRYHLNKSSISTNKWIFSDIYVPHVN